MLTECYTKCDLLPGLFSHYTSGLLALQYCDNVKEIMYCAALTMPPHAAQ